MALVPIDKISHCSFFVNWIPIGRTLGDSSNPRKSALPVTENVGTTSAQREPMQACAVNLMHLRSSNFYV